MAATLSGPTVGEAGEFQVIDAITTNLEQPDTTVVGPGDDAAVVLTSDGRVLASVDVLVDGVHFRTDWASGGQIGRRAALAAMADIAAMGARPTALLVGLSAPETTPVQLISEIAAGLATAAAEHHAGLVGGDLTRGGQLTISVTVLGDLAGRMPVRRSRAQVGDVLALTGRLGYAAAGLAVLTRGFRSPAIAVDAYRVPVVPLEQGPIAAAAGAHAMCDISDGLLADAGHIAAASEVAIDIDPTALQLPDRLLEVAAAIGADGQSWLLTGGDDHGLLATFPDATVVPDGWTIIGQVRQGNGVTVGGQRYDGALGWEHFGTGRR